MYKIRLTSCTRKNKKNLFASFTPKLYYISCENHTRGCTRQGGTIPMLDIQKNLLPVCYSCVFFSYFFIFFCASHPLQNRFLQCASQTDLFFFVWAITHIFQNKALFLLTIFTVFTLVHKKKKKKLKREEQKLSLLSVAKRKES